MSDNVNIIVQDTINEIVVNTAVIVETIDINVQTPIDEVTIITNPNNYIVNINRVIGQQVQSDWNQNDDQEPDYIKNKPTIPGAQEQSDWNETDVNKPPFIKNKPVVPTQTSELINNGDGSSGSYFLTEANIVPQVNSDWNAVGGKAEIFNKPTIPAEQVNSDWNAVGGKAEIFNKPTIPSISGLATTTYVDQQDALKVDKVTGYGLSQNDFTNTLKTKLAGIEAGAQVNVNADWNATTGDAEILNKPTIPSITNLVPYTGATLDVQLGPQTLSSGGRDETLISPTGLSIVDDRNGPSQEVTIAPNEIIVRDITNSQDVRILSNGIQFFDSTFQQTAFPPTGGTSSQYIKGDGTLAPFPSITGGGASVSYYLNGSVSQGTIGGVAYKEINSVPVIGAGTDFTINANGYIAQFITDVGDPNKLLIPAGNWNFETYFNASSGGGSPRFYIELYKYDGTNFTLIASNSANPEYITGGTNVDLYFSALAIPQTTLLATDRLAVRFYVIHSGRTITMHTENSNLSQIITTFSTGLTALNGLTSQTQNFAVGTSGSDFNISSVTDTHTFNLPTASASNRGALSSTNWSTFNNKQDALVSGTNIKSVNGISLLGSGDLSVKGVHALVKPSVGSSVTASVNSGSLSAQAQTANRLIVSPFIPAQTITCSSLFINVTTLSLLTNAQILIYSNLNGKPDTKIYQSANLDCSTTGLKTAATTQTFEAGVTYWIGVHTSGTQSLSVLSQPSLLTIFNSGITQITALFSLPTYGSAPTIFGVPSNTNGTMPLVGITI